MRYRLIDTFRGFSLISMILFHTCWDLVHLYGFDWPWFLTHRGYVWQQSICWAFILISGFSMGLQKEDRPAADACRHGLTVLAAGILVTAVTLVFMPEKPIIFGVLFFLGIAMIVTAVSRSTLRKISPRAGMLCCSILIFILRNINHGSLGFENIVLCRLPDFLYQHGLLATFFGLQDKTFISTDYFSFFPWYFLFLKGFFLCRNLLKRNAKKGKAGLPEFFERGIEPLAALGRRSLPIYLIHQPLILLLLSVLLKQE